ncbi:MmgE/PrpD family protein [Mycolicibacterium baixiangningiae]|uniref:MmgE/PrpD family protein n=1 Tax=Mycolicibacterium baixiangningiae TaxID=2761578 RepID=UPI001868479F|nr:MmgE/PrpD family protein [Mycolicibacterium baixiangningiae]
MTYIDDIVTFIATAESKADDQSPELEWGAVRAAVDAAAEHLPGADTSLAYAVGCVVAEEVAAVLDSAKAADGWSRRSVAGVIGAGAAVGRLLDFDDAKLRHLLGLCATQATGLRSLDDTDTGSLQVAKAAVDAVEAALLVSNGFTSSADGLTGRRGLFALMAPGATPPSTFDGGTRTEGVRHRE